MPIFNRPLSTKTGFERGFYDERVGFGTISQTDPEDPDCVTVAFSDREGDYRNAYISDLDLEDNPDLPKPVRMEDVVTDVGFAAAVVQSGIKQLKQLAKSSGGLYLDGGSIFWENVEI